MSIQQAILFGGWNIPTIESFHEDHFNPNNEKRENFCWMAGTCTEGCGMCIWGMLLASPVEMCDKVHIQDMVTSCIILHNMMVQQ